MQVLLVAPERFRSRGVCARLATLQNKKGQKSSKGVGSNSAKTKHRFERHTLDSIDERKTLQDVARINDICTRV